MRFSKVTGVLVLALALSAGSARPAFAQGDSSSADIQRLQDNIYEAARDIAQLRGRDATLASQLQSELDEARDEATYLKVKARKRETIAQSEYADLRDKVENIRSRARGDTAGGYTPPSSPRSAGEQTSTRSSSTDDVPDGAELDVRLQKTLSSATAQVEDRFDGTTMVDIRNGDRVIVPAGSTVRGVVSSVNKA